MLNQLICCTVLQALAPPRSSNSTVRGWLGSPQLHRMLKAVGALLSYSETQAEGPTLQRAITAVAELACSISPAAWPAAVAAVEALQAAEAGAAREKAAVGYAFVAFEVCLQLCSALLAQRLPNSSPQQAAADAGRWQLVAAAAGCMAEQFSRAQLCVSSTVRGPALRQAEDVLHSAISTPVAAQLCCCLSEASAAAVGGRSSSGAAAAAAAAAVIGALCALVHAGAVRSNGSCVADHFPLAQLMSAKIAAPPDHGLDTDANLVDVSDRLLGYSLYSP